MQRGIVGLCCVFTLESRLIGGSAWTEEAQSVSQQWQVSVGTNTLNSMVASKTKLKSPFGHWV